MLLTLLFPFCDPSEAPLKGVSVWSSTEYTHDFTLSALMTSEEADGTTETVACLGDTSQMRTKKDIFTTQW